MLGVKATGSLTVAAPLGAATAYPSPERQRAGFPDSFTTPEPEEKEDY